MSDQCDSMAATTVANAMRESPSFHTVHFPVTGDHELDAISGMLAVVMYTGISSTSAIAVLKFMLDRSEWRAKQEMEDYQRKERERERMYQAAAKYPTIGAGQAIGPICPPNPGDWTIGGAPYPGSLGPITTAGQALANATFQPGKGIAGGKPLVEVFMEEQKRETLKKTLEDYATPTQIKR